MISTSVLRNFCEQFDAHVEPSNQVFYRHQFPQHPLSIDHFDTVDYNPPETIEAVSIHMPKDRLDDLLDLSNEQQYRAYMIRQQVPAVKKAYENYLLLLKMCGGEADGY